MSMSSPYGRGAGDSAGTLLSSATGGRDSVAWLLSLTRQRGMVAAGAGGGPRQRGNLAAVFALKINLS
jgi:hypothetical protein